MRLTFNSILQRYYVECRFDERFTVKKAGFKWDANSNFWYTDNWYVAFKLARNANIDTPYVRKFTTRINQSYATQANSTEISFPVDSRVMPFQKAGIDLLLQDGNVLLADEQGLGKTLQAVIAATHLGQPLKVLVLCPSTLKINWKRESEQWSSVFGSEIHITKGGKDTINLNSQIVIANYDLLKSKLIFDQIMEYDADAIILDEAHYLKTPTALRTKAALKVAKKARKVIAITGTPILNRPIELFPLLNAISPETIAPYNDFRSFAFRFCGAYQGKWGFVTDGATNIDELNIRLRATCMIRRLKKDVLDQLPDKMPPHIIAFEQDKETKAVIKKETTLDIEDLKKCPEKMNIGDAAKIRHELALAKLPKCIEYINQRLLNGNKIVVFAHHRDVIDELYKTFFNNAAMLRGGVSDYQKQHEIDRFQNKPECTLFIGQIQAAGVGITLTAASEVIFVETSWTPGEINQCIDRCHRIGQKNSVTSTFLTVENSIEETMLKVIFSKEKIINQILK